tara:strand:- start:16 stop:1638 length:1623 start_codon:yes stop_codon:yes gene_type:complete
MLFSSSPVKKISEKIKPISESGKRKVSRLKFDRKSDYKTFLDFIKKNTKDLEEQQVKKEKTSNKGAFGLIGLGILGGVFGGGKKDDNIIKASLIPKAIQRAKLNAEKEAKKKGKAGSGVGASAAQFFKKVTQLNKPFIPKRDPQTYRQKGANKKEYIFNRERRNKIVKSKQSVVSEETVYNKNRVKKKLVNTRVAAEIGGSGTGGASGNRRMINVSKTFPEDSSVGNRPPSSLGQGDTPEDIKKAIKLTQDFESGKITRQQYDAEMNKIKKFKPTDKTPKTLDQIAKDLGKGKKTFKLNFGRGIQGEIFGLGNVSGDGNLPFDYDTFNYDKSKSKNKINAFKQPSLLDELIFGGDKNKPLKMFDRKIPIKDRFMFNPNTNRAGDSRFTSMGNFFGDKSFTAPDVPKGQPKLSGFDKFNRFTSRVMNSPAYKFGSFIGGMMANYKLEIIKQLLTPTPLADGTLEGKPGVGINPENFIFNEDAAVNVFNFSEGRESMIPFSSDVKLPSVSTPTNLIKPENNVFIDFEFDATEDLFFMKMAGS